MARRPLAGRSVVRYRGVEVSVTPQQGRLLELLDRRVRHERPTVQRDLAETLGIRRDSLNKLLARTRVALADQGVELAMPPRSRDAAAFVVTLDGSGLA